LRLAEIENSRRSAGFGIVALDEMLREVCDIYEPIAENKNIALRVGATQPLTVRGDRDLLIEAVANLVDNAIKFTPDGGRILIRAAFEDRRVILSVSDTGIGIPPGELGRIFERFYRVDRSRDRKEGGTGLGLAIAKHLTQAMGGTIEAESAPGAGTTFRITLPAGG
jgi:signal transduction histidine kinase